MNLSSKHQQSIVSYGNFTGGLNTTTVPEMIGDNQMADCINMEFNRTTGALQTCCGTATVFTCPEDITIDQLWYDEINNVFLFTDANTRSIYKSRLVDMDGTHAYDHEKIGVLTGERKPTAVMWENGMVIASGGRLQYWDGNTLESIQTDFEYEQKVYEWKSLGESITEDVWASDRKYAFSDIVKHEDKYYYCLTEHTSTTEFVNDNWQELTDNGAWEYDKYYSKHKDVVKIDGMYYLAEDSHTSVTDAPVVCNGVFVKNGRVAVWHEYTIQFSGIGDERCWYDLPDDDSTSKYQDVGYKEGEKEQAYIIGACALSNDIVIIKNDGKIYRLAGEYPNWVLKEIARDINCLNPQCYVSVQDGVFIVGREGMFLLSTTVDYGDVKPTNVASGIMGLLGILSVEESYVKFMPSLNQIWVAGYENRFICFDLTFKAFFQRQFNSKVTDVCRYKSYYMLSRKHSVTELMQGIFKDELYSDNESEMIWKIVAKTHTSFYEFLLKRMRIAYVPLMDEFNEASLITGEGKIIINLPERKKKTAQIVPDKTFIVSDSRLVFPMDTQLITKWMVYRDMRFGIKLEGKGSAIMINKIDSAIAEV